MVTCYETAFRNIVLSNLESDKNRNKWICCVNRTTLVVEKQIIVGLYTLPHEEANSTISASWYSDPDRSPMAGFPAEGYGLGTCSYVHRRSQILVHTHNKLLRYVSLAQIHLRYTEDHWNKHQDLGVRFREYA
jgi:hypothetical protein